jgi:hypothetical protein
LYSKVDSLFWKDVKNKTLPDNEKLLFLYLLTCPHRNVLGYYIMPLPYISADLKWKLETVKERFTQLLDKGYINYDFDAEVVIINNFLKYNTFENPNQVVGAIKSLEVIPACGLDKELLEALNRNKTGMCAGKKGDYDKRYETLTQTVAQRVTSTVTVAVTVTETVAVIDNSDELSSCHNFADGEDCNEKKTGKKYSHESKYYQAAKWLSEHILGNSRKKIRTPTESNLQAWANTFRLMEESDEIPWEDIRTTLKFAITDEFWSAVILSARNFREKYNQLVVKMQSQGGNEYAKHRGDSNSEEFKPSRS